MGIVHKGIPHLLCLDLAEEHDINVFVETGTHVGKTAVFASQWFHTVHTVEAEQIYYQKAKRVLRPYPNVNLYFGSSQFVLPEIISQINEPVLFWLDAHWSRDLEGSKPAIVCPVLDEIEIIKQFPYHHIIMIDDARLFSGRNGWPSLKTVESELKEYQVTVKEDVIVGIPK